MGTINRCFVVAACVWLVLLHLTAACGQASARTTLRTPAQGELVDGMPLYSAPASNNEGVLVEMASRAAVIFVGTVTAVQKPTDDMLRAGSGGAVVEVDFQVERSVRGATTGVVYALREWAGMWRDNQRFLPGQRLLMMLHAPGPGGLSSPVDGLDGAIPIRGGGLPAKPALTAREVRPEAEAAMPGEQVDMRWLQAKTLKTISYADAPAASPGVTPVNIVADPGATSPTGLGTGQTTLLSTAGRDGGSELLSRVLGLLGTVEALNQALPQAGRSGSN